jgi:hypothetical protein
MYHLSHDRGLAKQFTCGVTTIRFDVHHDSSIALPGVKRSSHRHGFSCAVHRVPAVEPSVFAQMSDGVVDLGFDRSFQDNPAPYDLMYTQFTDAGWAAG